MSPFIAERKQRASNTAVGVVLAHLRDRLSPQIGEEGVRVQVLIGELLADGEMILVGAALGGETNAHGAHGRCIRAKTCGRNRHFLRRTDPFRRERIETRSAALETLGIVVHAIDGNRHGGVGKTIERVSAGPGLRARHQQSEVQRIEAAVRQVQNVVIADRGADFVRGGFQLRRRGGDLDGLGRGAHRQMHRHVGYAAGIHHDRIVAPRSEIRWRSPRSCMLQPEGWEIRRRRPARSLWFSQSPFPCPWP